MIDSYNDSSGGPAITMPDMTFYGGNGSAQPATGVSWNEAARFVNWLNTSEGHSVAYQFDTGGANDNISLWEAGDAGYDPSNPFRNSNAYYFLPSEDEWYKAAYYDPNHGGAGVGGYWNYATGSDAAPTLVANGTASGTVVFGQAETTGPAPVTNAGGLSPYGTMAQSGNVWEWGESGLTPPNDLADESRVLRGGVWFRGLPELNSSISESLSPTSENGTVGFRVASVPEPSAFFMTLLGMMGLLRRSRRV